MKSTVFNVQFNVRDIKDAIAISSITFSFIDNEGTVSFSICEDEWDKFSGTYELNKSLKHYTLRTTRFIDNEIVDTAIVTV